MALYRPGFGAVLPFICPDLTGYGFSSKPPPSTDHAAYAKRAMARDLLVLMEKLGHPRFCIVAHDRGARLAHRPALDALLAVECLCLMDIVPMLEHFEPADAAFALGYWHWFLLAQLHIPAQNA